MPDEFSDQNDPKEVERLMIEEMLRDGESHYWEIYFTFVRKNVYTRVRNMSRDDCDEIISDIMLRMVRYLPHFRQSCNFTTWLRPIILSCIADRYRTKIHQSPLLDENHFLSPDPFAENGPQEEDIRAKKGESAEEAFIKKEAINSGWEAIKEYALTHANSTRNYLILSLVMLEGRSHVEVAIEVGCSSAVVGYVVREAQRYAREKRGQ